ncbi:MAG: hypothetical protein AAGJ28_00380 [Pseudomonadota bacterium]
MSGRDSSAFGPLIRARHRVLADLYAPSPPDGASGATASPTSTNTKERSQPMNQSRDYVYADSMMPIANVDDIDRVMAELQKDEKDIDLFVLCCGVFALLRRLQIAENQDRLDPSVKAYYDGLQRLGLHESDARP